MDTFQKATLAYALALVITGAVRTVYPIATFGFIIAHLVYLKFAMDDVVEQDASRLWLPGFGLFGLLVAIPYLFTRK